MSPIGWKTRYNRFFFGVMIGLLLLPLVGHYAKWLWLIHHAEQGRWYEDKIAKAALLTAKSSHPDVIFVGASTTQNHINTHELSQNGINAFNFGVPGMFWEEYPYMVMKASEYANRLIVINIFLQRLQQPISCPKLPTLYDLWFYLNFKPKCVLVLSQTQRNAVWLWRRPIIKAMETEPGHGKDGKVAESWLHRHFGFELANDERKFSFIRGSATRKVILFDNGDGLVFTLPQVPFQPVTTPLPIKPDEVHPEALAYLKRLLILVKDHDLEPVILLDGYVEQWTPVLADYLRKTLAAFVIDNTKQKHPVDHWSDPQHYNVMGAKQHTRFLHAQLAPILRKTAHQ
jgi:hypothetical protein